MVRKVEDITQKSLICQEVLDALPDWFGIPESVAEYVKNSSLLPMWMDIKGGDVRGFIVLRETSPYAAEIYVMGVKKEYHRQGVGRALFEALYEAAKVHGYRFLHVKTVQEGHYADYDQTNAFYKGVGFVELECLADYWDAENPCQIYVMPVL